jgi:hypothetical protein
MRDVQRLPAQEVLGPQEGEDVVAQLQEQEA